MGVSHSAQFTRHSLSLLSLSVSELRVRLTPGPGSLWPRLTRDVPAVRAQAGWAGLRGNFYGQKAGAGDSSHGLMRARAMGRR